MSCCRCRTAPPQALNVRGRWAQEVVLLGYSTRWGYREVRRGRSATVALGHGARLALAIHRQRHPRPQQWLSMSMLAQPIMTRL